MFTMAQDIRAQTAPIGLDGEQLVMVAAEVASLIDGAVV